MQSYYKFGDECFCLTTQQDCCSFLVTIQRKMFVDYIHIYLIFLFWIKKRRRQKFAVVILFGDGSTTSKAECRLPPAFSMRRICRTNSPSNRLFISEIYIIIQKLSFNRQVPRKSCTKCWVAMGSKISWKNIF